VREPITTLGVTKLKELVILASESEEIMSLNSKMIEGCLPSI